MLADTTQECSRSAAGQMPEICREACKKTTAFHFAQQELVQCIPLFSFPFEQNVTLQEWSRLCWKTSSDAQETMYPQGRDLQFGISASNSTKSETTTRIQTQKPMPSRHEADAYDKKQGFFYCLPKQFDLVYFVKRRSAHCTTTLKMEVWYAKKTWHCSLFRPSGPQILRSVGQQMW